MTRMRFLHEKVLLIVLCIILPCVVNGFTPTFHSRSYAQEPNPILSASLQHPTSTAGASRCYSRDPRFPREKASSMSMSQESGGSGSDNSPKVRFAEEEEGQSTLDAILYWMVSDIGSIVLGGIGLVLVLLGRLLSPETNDSAEAMGEETRVNLLAVLACGSVLLNGLSKLDVTTAMAETVQLVGTFVETPVLLLDNASEKERGDLAWLMQAVVTATPAETAVVVKRIERNDNALSWHVVGYGGTLPPSLVSPSSSSGPIAVSRSEGDTPILNRFLQQREQESYLPTLQALPGKSEFESYLSSNTQAVLLVPFFGSNDGNDDTRRQVLVLGSNQARSFTPRDIAWCQAAVRRIP